MAQEQERKHSGEELPENAFRPLAPGEEYHPLMSPQKDYPEVTFWSVGWGILMAVIFSAAAAFLGLKIGQVFEAAIPISIIAVGLSSAAGRKKALGENVIIQSIGACSGVIVAGAIFTLPALYILQETHPELAVNFLEVFLSSLLGGILGILFLIPFRKYFVKQMHGKYPFPEATATTAGARFGTEGRCAGPSAGDRRTGGRFVRLPAVHLRLVGGGAQNGHPSLGSRLGRENQTRLPGQYRSSRTGIGLYRGAEVQHHHLRRFAAGVVGDHPADGSVCSRIRCWHWAIRTLPRP